MNRRYPEHPVVGVGVVVLRGDRVLLIRRAEDPGKMRWSLPGGVQELGETVFEAARREVLEETALPITVLGLVDVVDSIRRDAQDRIEYHYTLVDVAAEAPAGEAKAASDAADCAWYGRDQIAGLGLWRKTVEVIDAAFALRDRLGRR